MTWRRLLVVLLLVASSASCATLPRLGQVRTDRKLLPGADIDRPDVRLLAAPPTRDASPTVLVAAFLLAQAVDDIPYEVARDYLTPGGRWLPDRPVVVQDDSPTFSASVPADTSVGARATVTVTAARVARLDDHGVYTAERRQVAETYQLVRVATPSDGPQWRIGAAPAGLRITVADLERSYRRATVYWLDPSGLLVVPQPTYLRTSSRGLPSAVVRALLAGPDPALVRSVSTAIPTGLDPTGSTSVTDGVAEVVLPPSVAAKVSGGALAGLVAQVTWSLTSLPGARVTGVRLMSGGRPLVLPDQDVGQVERRVDLPGFEVDQSAAARRLVYVPPDPKAGLQVGGAALQVDGGAPTAGLSHPALSPGRGLAALRPLAGGRGVELVTGQVAPQVQGRDPHPQDGEGLVSRRRAAHLTTPSWGSGTAVYTVATEPGQAPAVIALPADGGPAASIELQPALRASDQITALEVSPDGTRIALLLGRSGAATLRVGHLVPATKDGAAQLEGLTVVDPDLADVTGFDWVDGSTLAVLAPRAGKGTAPLLVSVDGAEVTATSSVGLPADSPAAVTAAGDGLVVAVKGALLRYRRDQSDWTDLQPGTDPAFPG